ncbi:MAG: hypothetical protein NTX53_06735, partial [candidate division WOR-3 bacterium]|nr:hypothetical protein [candidate division WOR-3 bacterium]
SQALAWRKVKPRVVKRLDSAGVMLVANSQYQLFANEVVGKYRTLTRVPLVAALEQVIHKWARYGFDPELLQQLFCDCHRRFLMLGYAAPKTTTSIGKPQRKRRKPRTYEQALKQHKVRLSPGRTVEQQSADYEAALAHNREISARVSKLLKAKGIPGREFIRYNAFAYRVGRYCRGFSGPSLNRAVSGILDEFESKGLDRPTLFAIASVLFNLSDLS